MFGLQFQTKIKNFKFKKKETILFAIREENPSLLKTRTHTIFYNGIYIYRKNRQNKWFFS